MRDINKLHPELLKIVPVFLDKCKAAGLPVMITETFRTKEEQDALYAQGRTKPGKIVTRARYPYSAHCWGVAFDFCRNVKGREWDNSDSFFHKVGSIGVSLGLEWGGNWKSFVDLPHLQLKKFMPQGTTAWLIQKYGAPCNFIASWETIHAVQKAAVTAAKTASAPTLSFEDLLQNMVSLGVIDDVDGYKDMDVEYLPELLLSAFIGQRLDKRIDNGIKDISIALSVLVDAGITDIPDYWRGLIDKGWPRVTAIILHIANRCRIVLEKIVQAEAGGEDELGQMMVCGVIMNRCKHKSFPNGIYNVVFQPKQFSPIEDGAYRRAMPSESVRRAVTKVLDGLCESQSALYFRTIKGATPDCWHERALHKCCDHGGHRFYR
jgi:peptidoglycan L-alanyl-D-glutamate endopeptidase CwlK